MLRRAVFALGLTIPQSLLLRADDVIAQQTRRQSSSLPAAVGTTRIGRFT